MNFALSEDQEMFRAAVERFAGVGTAEARKAARTMSGGVDRKRWTELAELGLLSLDNLIDCAVIAETLGRSVAVEPWLESGYFPLQLLRGSAWSNRVADGSLIAAVAFAEPGRRYALDPKTTRASGGEDAFTLTGSKTFVLGGAVADLLLVTADLDGNTALLAVDASDAEIRPYTVVDGSVAAEVRFHQAKAERLSLARWDEALSNVRLIAAAEMVGLASRMLDNTLDYVRQRQQFGQPIGSFQAIQHRLVDCYTMLELMRSLLWRTAMAQGDPDWLLMVAGTKAFIAERALHIGEEAIQFHGGMGVTDELMIGHAHKRVLLLSKLFGDPAAELALYATAA
jgi:alkylation response protein AidB-like acyl-CoA dehydrogenase